ncbi:SEL1-like repeat protein [Oxalobacter vibrioformis]|uniref:SEL1-like repeat protein n=1 Tax=Oxalobacter vibrioformis TaxID=933080 RepID=A0A9E9LWA0_9BURK|nr:SEL1-like repeat protein [Oxalobacter vibrioformis]WAW09857.1 SEL1-like repeat protein [Oxalobacter vibrioformis]
MMGKIYEEGRGGIATDREKAQLWYQRAAAKGEERAIRKTGMPRAD